MRLGVSGGDPTATQPDAPDPGSMNFEPLGAQSQASQLGGA
jgi:hypothetical protein